MEKPIIKLDELPIAARIKSAKICSCNFKVESIIVSFCIVDKGVETIEYQAFMGKTSQNTACLLIGNVLYHTDITDKVFEDTSLLVDLDFKINNIV